MKLLLLLAAIPHVAAVHAPRLSWETVGDLAFFHSSVMNRLTFNASDLLLASKFPMVTIEKWQGCNSTPGCYGSTDPSASCPTQEDATLATARKLKAIDPTMFVVSWLDSMRVYEAIEALNPDYRNIMNQACVRTSQSVFLDTHSEYLLPNASGKPALESFINAHVYDHRSIAVRDLWRDVCLNMTSTGLVDGCGADASQQSSTYIQGVSADVGAAWELGRNWSIGNTTAALAPQGGVVLGKMEFELGAYTNGVLQEGCVKGNATINVLREAAAASVRDGVTYIYQCHSNGEMDDLAAFLVGAYKGAFWGFGGWVQANDGFSDRWLPIFDKPLGAPVADAEYNAESAVWTRSFASASVTFDVKSNTGNITFI